MQPGGFPDRIAADVLAVIQPGREIDRSDRIDVEVGALTDQRGLGGLAGDQQQVGHTGGPGAQQVGLNACEASFAAGIVDQRLDAPNRHQ